MKPVIGLHDRLHVARLMPVKGSNSYPGADVLAERDVPFFFATGNHGQMADGYANRAVLRKPFMSGDLATIFTGLLFH